MKKLLTQKKTTKCQVHENEKERPLQRSSKVTHPLQRLVESIDYTLIIKGEKGNEPITLQKGLIKLDTNTWKEMVMEKYTFLKKNKTWVLTTLLNGRFVVGHKWVFKLKLKSNNCVDHFEACFIAKGYSQVSLAKITSIRALMTVVERDLELHQMDVKIVKENIYMQQLKGYVKLGRKHLVCKLRKTFHGIKQSSKAWYKWIDSYILKDKFKKNNVNTYVYIKSKEDVYEMLILSIDDVIKTNNSLLLLQQTKEYLLIFFEMVNMGPYFLGIQVQTNRTTRTIHLH